LSSRAKPRDLQFSQPAAIASYLEEIRTTKKPKTLAAYALSLEYFDQYCQKPHVSDVERPDLLAYSSALRDAEELAARTVHNHFANLVSFLKWAGRERIVVLAIQSAIKCQLNSGQKSQISDLCGC
jgi:site-specific recombinase XerD